MVQMKKFMKRGAKILKKALRPRCCYGKAPADDEEYRPHKSDLHGQDVDFCAPVHGRAEYMQDSMVSDSAHMRSLEETFSDPSSQAESRLAPSVVRAIIREIEYPISRYYFEQPGESLPRFSFSPAPSAPVFGLEGDYGRGVRRAMGSLWWEVARSETLMMPPCFHAFRNDGWQIERRLEEHIIVRLQFWLVDEEAEYPPVYACICSPWLSSEFHGPLDVELFVELCEGEAEFQMSGFYGDRHYSCEKVMAYLSRLPGGLLRLARILCDLCHFAKTRGDQEPQQPPSTQPNSAPALEYAHMETADMNYEEDCEAADMYYEEEDYEAADMYYEEDYDDSHDWKAFIPAEIQKPARELAVVITYFYHLLYIPPIPIDELNNNDKRDAYILSGFFDERPYRAMLSTEQTGRIPDPRDTSLTAIADYILLIMRLGNFPVSAVVSALKVAGEVFRIPTNAANVSLIDRCLLQTHNWRIFLLASLQMVNSRILRRQLHPASFAEIFPGYNGGRNLKLAAWLWSKTSSHKLGEYKDDYKELEWVARECYGDDAEFKRDSERAYHAVVESEYYGWLLENV